MGVMAQLPRGRPGAASKSCSRCKSATARPCTSSIPLTMVANEGDSARDGGRPEYYGDDHLWIVLAVCAYLKETGDLAFLDAR